MTHPAAAPDEQTVAAIVAKWPSVAALARDLRLSHFTVAAWLRRDSIPVVHWESLVKAARRRRVRGVTFISLRTIATAAGARRRPAVSSPLPLSLFDDASPVMINKPTAVVQDAQAPQRASVLFS